MAKKAAVKKVVKKNPIKVEAGKKAAVNRRMNEEAKFMDLKVTHVNIHEFDTKMQKAWNELVKKYGCTDGYDMFIGKYSIVCIANKDVKASKDVFELCKKLAKTPYPFLISQVEFSKQKTKPF